MTSAAPQARRTAPARGPGLALSLLLAWLAGAAHADALHPKKDDSVDDLSRAAQNPVADMVSLPFQNNLQRLENGATFNALLIQPVVPFKLSSDWNLITRTIIPVLALSRTPDGVDNWALGDIQQSFFISPANPSGLIWGAGPVLSYRTASDSFYGSGKWSAGPAAVALGMSGPWVFGALLNNIWSYAGDSSRRKVNLMSFQPFVNYNFGDGWFLQTSPLITADWEANSDNRWTVPVGGGAGRTFKIGSQVVTGTLTGFYNVERPDGGARWNIRAQMSFLFPR